MTQRTRCWTILAASLALGLGGCKGGCKGGGTAGEKAGAKAGGDKTAKGGGAAKGGEAAALTARKAAIADGWLAIVEKAADPAKGVVYGAACVAKHVDEMKALARKVEPLRNLQWEDRVAVVEAMEAAGKADVARQRKRAEVQKKYGGKSPELMKQYTALPSACSSTLLQ